MSSMYEVEWRQGDLHLQKRPMKYVRKHPEIFYPTVVLLVPVH